MEGKLDRIIDLLETQNELFRSLQIEFSSKTKFMPKLMTADVINAAKEKAKKRMDELKKNKL